MAKFTPVITKELQETVRKNPHIKTVYFDEKGHHYFRKHTVEVHTDNGAGHSKGSKKVDALPGVKQGVLKVTMPNKTIKDKKVNVDYNAIAAEMDRDEILDAETASRTYTDQEKEDILKAAEEIKRTSGAGKASNKANGKTKEKDNTNEEGAE